MADGDTRSRTRPRLGIGYRREVAHEIAGLLDEIDVVEVTADHYVYGNARVRRAIVELSGVRPIVAHGVGLSIGTALPPEHAYLDAVAEFIEAVHAPWYSEHLAFTKVPGGDLAQLLPVPRTDDAAAVLLDNIAVVKQHVTVPLLFENISYYYEYARADYDEAEFLTRVLREAGARLLLDLENVRINASNHRFDPVDFLDRIPKDLVGAVHLAGGEPFGPLVLDSHDHPVPSADLDLLAHLLREADPDTVVIERDGRLDDFEEVRGDVRRTAAALEAERG